MPFLVQEWDYSRKVTIGKDRFDGKLEYVGFGSSNDATARAAFQAALPATFLGLTLIDFDIYTIGGGFWKCEARYLPDPAPRFPGVGGVGPPPIPIPPAPTLNQPLGPSYSFDFTGVEEHITQSKETVKKSKRGGGVAADCKGAIGATKDGRVEGCTKLSPNLEWSVSVTFDFVTMQYIQDVGKLVGQTNDDTFYGFPAESLIFMGGTLQTQDLTKAVATFKFLYRANISTDIVILPDEEGSPGSGLKITGGKKGSEYLWVSYKDVDNNVRITQQPDSAYVERIVDKVDFGLIGIGE